MSSPLRFLAALYLVFGGPSSSRADDVFTARGQELYESVFRMSGLFLRASSICSDGDSKTFINTAFALQTATPELETVSKSYPSATTAWLKLGGEMMNAKVMKEGLPEACFRAGALMYSTIPAIAARKALQK